MNLIEESLLKTPNFISVPTKQLSSNRHSSMTYESKETFRLPNTNRYLNILNNFRLDRDISMEAEKYKNVLQNSKELKDVKIPGRVVTISFFSGMAGYFHYIFNVLGEIEMIQKFYPDTKIKIIIFLDPNNRVLEHLKNNGTLDAYGIADDDIINLSDIQSLEIEQLLFIYSDTNHLTKYMAHHEFNYDAYPGVMDDWGMAVRNGLRNRFITAKEVKPTRKIFISRLKDNDFLRSRSDVIHKMLLGYELDLKDFQLLVKMKKKEFLEHADRPMVRSEEKRLEQLFRDAGYEIIDPGKDCKTIQDQANLYASASHIVGLSGAGFVNCCFANESAKILVLNSSTSYGFPHLEIVKSFGLEAYEAPKRFPWHQQRYFADAIFNYAKRKLPDFF